MKCSILISLPQERIDTIIALHSYFFIIRFVFKGFIWSSCIFALAYMQFWSFSCIVSHMYNDFTFKNPTLSVNIDPIEVCFAKLRIS